MSAEQVHVLVAVGDPAVRRALLESLTAMGFRFEETTGEGLLNAVREGSFDLVLLDPGPEQHGLEMCRTLRASYPELGIVVVRAGGTAADEAIALDAGANDSIAAPVRFRELVARLRAVLQRFRAEPLQHSTLLRAGDLEMDPSRRLFRRARQEVHLSPHQFDLLLFLMRHPEVTLTRIKLLRAVLGGDCCHDAGYLRSYIKALRRKIEVDPARPQYILTEPWVGYRFHDPARSQ